MKQPNTQPRNHRGAAIKIELIEPNTARDFASLVIGFGSQWELRFPEASIEMTLAGVQVPLLFESHQA